VGDAGLDSQPLLGLVDQSAELGEDDGNGCARPVERLDALEARQHGAGFLHSPTVADEGARKSIPIVPTPYTRPVATCPSCGEENPERARFCLACGTALTAPPSTTEERKVVSVLFVDLVGFTAGADRADPEDVRATLRPYHARVSREIERFGGTVEKFVGDAVMAVFGAPVAHEDDAERAVRSALRILDAIDELNEHEGLDLAIRAAVATGEAVVQLGARPGTGEGIAMGDVVNTAARLQSEAPTGGLVVNEQAFRATRDAIEFEGLAPVTVKGKADPVPLWRARSARSSFGVDVESSATPFVGRARELRLLQDTFERMVEETEIQLVTITGEPGVGKTRLLSELRKWVDDREELVRWRQGRCLPYGEGITYWALGEIVKAHAGIRETDGADEASEKLRRTIEDGDAAWLHARLRPLVGLPGTDMADRDESFAAWQRYVEGIAANGPLVLLFEDLHWADPALLAFVEHLVDWSRDLPILVLCTGRPELFERHRTWGGGTRNSATVSLSPLSTREVESLVSALLERAVLPDATMRELIDRSGGNPLYAEEYVRLLLEGDGAVGLAMPDSVHGIIAARLDTLTGERKTLLQDAAVMGKVFWAGAVAEMGDRRDEEVRAELHQLARKELVRPVRLSSVDGDSEYAFWHALIRDVAYGQIPRAQRAKKHLAAAGWIERVTGERSKDHAELLVHHYDEALALTETSSGNGEADTVRVKLGRALVLAGDRAGDLDLPAARAAYKRALPLLPAPSEEHALVLLKLGDATMMGAMFEESRAALVEGAQELEAVGSLRRAGEAYGMLGRTYFQIGRGDETERALRRALGLLEALPPGPELVDVYGRMASTETLNGNPPGAALAWADKAIGLGEELGLRRELVRAYQWRGLMRCELGDLGGVEDLEHGLHEALELGVWDQVVPAFTNRADVAWRAEGPKAALDLHDTAIAFRVDRGGAPPIWTLAESCWMLYDSGGWDELLRHAEDVRHHEQQHGMGQPGAMVETYAAFVLMYRGEHEQNAELAVRLRRYASDIDDPQVTGPALVASALLAETQGSTADSIAFIAEFCTATEKRPYFRAQNATDAVRVACRGGDLVLAERVLENVITAMTRDRLSTVAGRAAIAEARGEHESALEGYEEASAGWASYGCPLEQGFALAGAGRCLVALDRPAEAAARFDDAHAVFETLGARQLVDQTAARTAK
jgi:class 3 adenylate cyclase/tetratricopeptide (TPR) repeat protein